MIQIPPTVDVVAVRAKTGMTQIAFSEAFGIPLSTLRNWEQGRTQPESAVRLLFTLFDRDPYLLKKVIQGKL